jgi:hypothetical protein
MNIDKLRIMAFSCRAKWSAVTMRCNTWLIIGSMVLYLILVSPFAFATPSEHLNWGAQLNSGSQSCPSGTLVINVVQKVVNDADSGVGGNAWAFDDYVRQIQVVQTSSGTFCATVSYQGNFTTNAGPSPDNTGTVGADVVGTFQGGYVSTTFSATLTTSPTYRKKGSIGEFDYGCDTSFNCPGYVDWTSFYFTGISGFDLAWWGWVYHAGNNGSWINAITGNSGDITGN